MLLDFSADWQWIIGGINVSPFVETWELAREQPDMGTPAWWRGKLVLRPVVGRDLNLDPLTNSLWRQGTICSLTVAGYLVFTGFILLAYYDDWSTAPRLELEVGDVLAARNHRQVIPFGEYNAQSLLSALGIPGVAPAGDTVEISTDLTSPVKVLQELTWVTGLKEWGLPATLFTRPEGQVDYVSPQAEILLTRTLEQVADFTRQRPALEIPGSAVASANLTYYVQPEAPVNKETSEGETALVSVEGSVVKVTYLDSFGRVAKEEIYKNGVLDGYTRYEYRVNRSQYEIVKTVFIRTESPYTPYVSYRLFEETRETGEKVGGQWISLERGDIVVYGQVVAQKKTFVYWSDWRLFPIPDYRIGYYGIFLVYLIEEYGILGRLLPSNFQQIYNLVAEATHILRMTTRAKGTTQDADTIWDAAVLFPAGSELIPNQQIQFPGWVKQFWEPPKPERVTDTLSEEVEVVGFTGPPVYVTIPWLSVTVDEPPGSPEFQQKIDILRQGIRGVLRAAASWMATEIAGRAFARRIKMPPPPEWLTNPRPWMLAGFGNEVFWLVGEVLRGTAQGVEFEATGILAGRPNTIPDIPDGIPFIPLITVVPTGFPKVGIGCEMGASEALIIPGDPWLGMAVEIEYEVSAPADTSAIVGISVGELTEAWLGLAADATHEITGEEEEEEEEEEEDGEVQGLTLEAEDGVINNGDVVYDADASSCYAVTTEYIYYDVYFSIDSTSLDWERPLRLRIIYKSAGFGMIDVFVRREEYYYYVDSFVASETFGYIAEELVIPTSLEPFDQIAIYIEKRSDEFLLDAIQLAPANSDWPPLNPCSD